MKDYDYIIDSYQRTGVPYNGRCDDIRLIVSNLSRHIYYGDTKVIEYLLSHYRNLSYISDISVDGNKCVIYYDEGIVSFNVFPSNYFGNFCKDIIGFDDVSGKCHEVTQIVLESCKSNNISAITSLCINTNYILYFHSYIYDRKEDKVIDFTKYLVMDKSKYDQLFCYKQLNDLNYKEFLDKLKNSDYYKSYDNLFPLIYLAVDELENAEKDSKVYKKKSKK